MPNLPICWQHFKPYIIDNPNLHQRLRKQIEQVQDRYVRAALTRTMKHTLMTSGLENNIPIEGIRNIVEDYDYRWVDWYSHKPEPLDWKSITHLKLYPRDEWPEKFPPKLKKLHVRNPFRIGGILKVPETVTHLNADLGLSEVQLPSGIEDLRLHQYSITSRSQDFTQLKKLRKLELCYCTDFQSILQLGPNLQELIIYDLWQKVAPGDMFPEGAADLQSLTLGQIALEPMKDADLQNMFTFSKHKFPNLQTLALYQNLFRLRENIRLRIPTSVTRLVIPVTRNMPGVLLQSLIDDIPDSLKLLEIDGIDNGFNTVDLRRLTNLSTVRLRSHSARDLPDIRFPTEVSTFYLNGGRIHRW